MQKVIRLFISGLYLAAVTGLMACASGPSVPVPVELGPNPALIGVRTAWSGAIGTVDFPLSVSVSGNKVTFASSQGLVVSMDAPTGTTLWRTDLGVQIAAGVGSDGRFSAVVSRENELIVLEDGREIWRTKLGSQVFTAPLVAGERVFILGADRSVAAYDARSGRKLWADQRANDALVLRQAGVLAAFNDTLIVGFSGRVVGLNPLTGSIQWDVSVSMQRGTNEIERLVDLVAGVGRDASMVCVRAFQSAVGCVNALQGNIVWKQNAQGSVGLSSDGKLLFGVEADGRLIAWKLSDGSTAWSSDRLLYRKLGSPLVLGQSVVFGDDSGIVHLVARSDGSPLTRLTTDGSAIVATPVVAGGTLIAVTRNGGVFGFKPE